MKKKKKIFAWIILTWFITSCGNQTINTVNQSDINADSWNSSIYKDNSTWWSNNISNNELDSDWTKLTISKKCIGCGICTRLAVNNFVMSWRKAIVISQNNLWSSNLSTAINSCPTKAISIK